MGPLLASFNVHPLVTSATSNLMVLFSSSAATASFALAGLVNLQVGAQLSGCSAQPMLLSYLLSLRALHKNRLAGYEAASARLAVALCAALHELCGSDASNCNAAPQYALTYGGVNLVSSAIGVLLISRAVKRSGKASLVVMILAAIIAIGAVLSLATQGRRAILDLVHHADIGFSPLCHAH